MYVSIDGIEVSLQDLVSSAKIQATRDKLKSAQLARSKKYGIKVQGGSLTIPAKLARMGAKENDFADPVHFSYPVWLSRTKDNITPAQLSQVRNALPRFEQNKNAYDAKSRAAVLRRIDESRKKFEVGEYSKTQKSEDELTIDFELLEKNEEKRLVTGIALIPNQIDSQGDIVSPEQIEIAAHSFLKDSRLIDLQHVEVANPSRATVVESWLAPIDLQIGSKLITKGSWIVTTYIPDDMIWKDVREGKYNGYSIRGLGKRKLI